LSKEDGVFLFNNRFGVDKELYTKSYFSIGIHPWDADVEFSKIEFENYLSCQNCIAIGECGIDKLKGADLDFQKTIFKFQLNSAVKYKKPVIIHCVKAFDEIIEICEPFQSKIPLIIHGFNKSEQLAKQLIDKGFYISFVYAIFKKNDFNFNTICLDNLFLETDNDDKLTIKEIYNVCALRFKISENDLKEKIYSNFTKLFIKNGR
jgi:TatD DNase family protein